MSSFRFVATPALLAAFATVLLTGLLTGTGCGPDEDTRLFDETGVWALESYSLDGGPYNDISQNRKNRFLLRFSPGDDVVAAAACHEQGTTVSVNSSNCTNAALSTWECRCFSYTYANDRMVWQEFTPGDTPPPVGAPSGDGDTEGGGDGAHELFVAGISGASSTYEFESLPSGLFDSNGMSSKHIFQIKADSVWTGADINGDGTNDLDACSASCFPSEAE